MRPGLWAAGLCAASSTGADVVCLERDWVPQSQLVRSRLRERVRVVTEDISRATLLERILGEYEVRTILHLAAQTIVGIANPGPISRLRQTSPGLGASLKLADEVLRWNRSFTRPQTRRTEHDELPYDECARCAAHPMT